MDEQRLAELKTRLRNKVGQGARMFELSNDEAWKTYVEWVEACVTKLEKESVSTGAVFELASDNKTRILLSPDQAALKHALLVGEVQGLLQSVRGLNLMIAEGRRRREELESLPADPEPEPAPEEPARG